MIQGKNLASPLTPSCRRKDRMKVFSLGLANLNPAKTITSLYLPPNSKTVPGLVHAECLTPMKLGSPILSLERLQFRKIVMFAAWESEDALEEFLNLNNLGQAIKSGWYIRMTFLRRWGSVKEFSSLPETVGENDPEAPVAAFTLARMRMLEIPRFVGWGRPVETLVRDNPNTTLTLAGIRHPRTIATFSIWKTQQAMIDMVHGHSEVQNPKRHIDAMKERDRRDFHHEFTTLRFKLLSEHGSWEGVNHFLPQNLSQ